MPDMIAQLMQADAYPHPCAPIRLVETHISWVLLTGEYAYKIKKPVDFGFLNFSTLASRAEFCHQELLLNRRLAPDLYLEVVPLHCTNGHWRVGADFPAEEYALKMRQFDQDQLLSRLQEMAALDESVVERLGEMVAQFHAGLPAAPLDAPWGSLDAILAPVEANFAQIGPRLTEESDWQDLHELQAWSLDQFEKLKPQFLQRKKHGHIREGHGDLHLGNLVLHQGQPLIFDCLEFNEGLRWIDVVSDMAFLYMDLLYREEIGLANRFLNAYLESSGDYEGLRLLRFYAVYRALVRAKVQLLCLDGLEDEATEAQLRQTYRQYIACAKRITQPAALFLVITHGVSGTGKTYAARVVCGLTGAIHVRSDVERKRLYGMRAKQQSHPDIRPQLYGQDMSARTFRQLEKLANLILQAGFPVIIDATFLHNPVRAVFVELARTRGIPYRILDCAVDEQTLRERIRARCARGDDASEATVEIMEQQIQHQDYLSQHEQRCALKLDTAQDLAPQLKQLTAWLK
jgi:aminoglycoside phosphotransferase family enzyme/predicted kinase